MILSAEGRCVFFFAARRYPRRASLRQNADGLDRLAVGGDRMVSEPRTFQRCKAVAVMSASQIARPRESISFFTAMRAVEIVLPGPNCSRPQRYAARHP